jgi:hypothetical protein
VGAITVAFPVAWLELGILVSSAALSYPALFLMSLGASTPEDGMAVGNVVRIMFGFSLLSFAIAVLAGLAGIGRHFRRFSPIGTRVRRIRTISQSLFLRKALCPTSPSGASTAYRVAAFFFRAGSPGQ